MLEKAKKHGFRRAWKYCDKAAIEFGKGLHSLQDTFSHRPWPFPPNKWPGDEVHPRWWDYFGPLPQPYAAAANSMGESSLLFGKEKDYHDNRWAKRAAENGWEGEVYDVWKNSWTQVFSQLMAQYGVELSTTSAIQGLIEEVGDSCACKAYFTAD